MSVNAINNATQAYDATKTTTAKSTQSQSTDETKATTTEDVAVVYEKSDTATTTNAKIYKRDDATVERLLAESEKRAKSMRDLVQQMLTKQGKTFDDTTDIYALLREGKVQVDPETKAKAQKDVAADGYWGVEQTADRMVSFAKALSGGDVSKANDMIDAVKKGFEAAKKAWGGDLPDISKQTMDAAIKKLEGWRDGTDSSTEMSNATADALSTQAITKKLTE